MSDETEKSTNEEAPVKPVAVIFTVEEIAQIVQIGVQFLSLLQRIQEAQPDAWASVSADFSEAVAAFEAPIIAAAPAPTPTPILAYPLSAGSAPAAPAIYGDASALGVGEHSQAPATESPVSVAGTSA